MLVEVAEDPRFHARGAVGTGPDRAEGAAHRRVAALTTKRTLIHSVLTNAGEIAVTDPKLRVTFVPLSSPHRTAALAALCAELDALAPRFAGTRLRVRYAVAL